ncbi:hypothetical protein PROFUN_03262 [Planoprotostelium fungivorum]|uniref:Uncharacterized protein n=1 Tax=Planoprotostelium fungivorum TaxID=1890364 RepID=A0A2P6NWT6_9EUKA|nr:hypothetical protein PROFUN_03262 [Planoprotostelium fungivorum]
MPSLQENMDTGMPMKPRNKILMRGLSGGRKHWDSADWAMQQQQHQVSDQQKSTSQLKKDPGVSVFLWTDRHTTSGQIVYNHAELPMSTETTVTRTRSKTLGEILDPLRVILGLIALKVPQTLVDLERAEEDEKLIWIYEASSKDEECKQFRNNFEELLSQATQILDRQCLGSWSRFFYLSMKTRESVLTKEEYLGLLKKTELYMQLASTMDSQTRNGTLQRMTNSAANVMLNQRTEAFKFRLAGHGLKRFLETHPEDPDSSIVGLMPSQSIIRSMASKPSSQSLSPLPSPGRNTASKKEKTSVIKTSSTDKAKKDKKDKKEKEKEKEKEKKEKKLAETKEKRMTRQFPFKLDRSVSTQSLPTMIVPERSLDNVSQGSIILVRLDEQWYLKATTRTEMITTTTDLTHPEGELLDTDLWQFARYWCKRGEDKIGVYLTAQEDRLFIVSLKRASIISLEGRLFDTRRMEGLVVDPTQQAAVLLSDRVRDIVLEYLVQRQTVPSLNMFLQWKRSVYSVADLPQIKRTLSDLQSLQSEQLPAYLLRRASECVDTHIVSFSRSIQNYFEPTRKHTVEKFRQTKPEELVLNHVRVWNGICSLALDDLRNTIKTEMLTGNVLNQMNQWWLELIEGRVNHFLEQYNFDLNAIPPDYAEKRPESMGAITRNRQLLKGILDEFNGARQRKMAGEAAQENEVDILIQGLKGEIYPVIEEYQETIRIILCDYFDHETFDMEKFERRFSIQTKEEMVQGKKMKHLMEDLKLLDKMKTLEDQTERASKDVVPISGLIINIFVRCQMDLEQVTVMWGEREKPPGHGSFLHGRTANVRFRNFRIIPRPAAPDV